jgi:ketosteroid isomerase-like protein
MGSKNIETVRAYWAASERGDWEAAGRCIGSGYTWIDHTTDVVARTPEELRAALEDAAAWSDERSRSDKSERRRRER